MKYAFKRDGQWVEFAGQKLPLDGGEDLYSVPLQWPANELLSRFGLHAIREMPTPEGKRLLSCHLVDDDGEPAWNCMWGDVPPPEPSEIEKLRAEIEALKAALDEKNLVSEAELAVARGRGYAIAPAEQIKAGSY